MGNMSGMFLFAFWVFSTQKCEAVNFPKCESAYVNARPFGYLGMPFLLRACAPCMCTACMLTMTSQGSHMMQTMSP